MTPARTTRAALRAMHIAVELVGELELGPLLATPHRAALDCLINAGAALEFLERCCLRLEREARRRFGASPKAATQRARFMARALRLSVEKKGPRKPKSRRK